MKKLIMLLGAMSFAISAAPLAKALNGVRFGKQVIVSGLWFSNFENSRFLECRSGKCEDQPLREWASITCENRACVKLDKEARRLTNSKEDTAPEGSFKIRFVGRHGVVRHKSRYIGDGERDILIERVLDIRKSP